MHKPYNKSIQKLTKNRENLRYVDSCFLNNKDPWLYTHLHQTDYFKHQSYPCPAIPAYFIFLYTSSRVLSCVCNFGDEVRLYVLQV